MYWIDLIHIKSIIKVNIIKERVTYIWGYECYSLSIIYGVNIYEKKLLLRL